MCDGTNYYLVLCKFTVGSSGALKNIQKKDMGTRKSIVLPLSCEYYSNLTERETRVQSKYVVRKKVHAFKNWDMP